MADDKQITPHVAPNGTVSVVFLLSWGAYQPEDSAGFDADQAAELVESKIARYLSVEEVEQVHASDKKKMETFAVKLAKYEGEAAAEKFKQDFLARAGVTKEAKTDDGKKRAIGK